MLRILILILVLGTGMPLYAGSPLEVTATTTLVADLVRQVGGDRVRVTGLMGPGVDPHLYRATASDVLRLRRAEAIFYNGFLLEGRMSEVLERLGRTRAHVYAVTADLPEKQLLAPEEFDGHFDPHVWFDVRLWKQCAGMVARALAEVDPEGSVYYAERLESVSRNLDELHEWALRRAGEVPPERRILVTSHDAFNYFGRAYGFQVVGLQGISTAGEVGLSDMTRMIEFIRENEIRAVFVETSVAPTAIQRIATDAGVTVGGELYSDALGTPGRIENDYDLGTYEGMFRYNLNTIVDALR